MTLTPAQQEAIAARGNVLVIAGAGTGKTRALVERCLSCLLKQTPPASLDEILVVTFTEAAAAEMRQRLRERLEQERQQQSQSFAWEEQLALFESAHIGTLHSFCLQLVRQHFYQLELDPQLSVLSEDEALLLAGETLDDLLQGHYAGKEPRDQAVQGLIQTQARGWEKPIRALVLRLHHYAQSLPNPAAWMDEQLAMFATPEPLAWRRWLPEALVDWAKESLAALEALSPSNEVAARCLAPVRKIAAHPSTGPLARLFDEIERIREDCPLRKTTLWLDPLKQFYLDADFLASLIPIPGQAEPLAEDWAWVRDQMTTLLQLVREFSQAFTEAKRELGVVDFHDLEQHSLRLLWDSASARPTDIALQWRRKLRFVFVDEYQDINPAQDRILQALSREGDQANRFLVGDVKQSIYRFRLANPRIFRDYAEQWARGPGRAIPLVENFRSREAILNFANSVFGLLMRRELGGLDYDTNAALRFGAPQERKHLSLDANPDPCVELRLFLRAGPELPESDESAEALAEVTDLREAEKEARMVGLRLGELRARQHPVWDEQIRQFRPVDWKDMAILLRSPAKKAQSYAKEFARLGLPLQVARAGFYQSTEISDLLSLLQLLDNPLQDLPTLAVLHSPLVGLNPSELAQIRLAAHKVRFWVALLRWHKSNPPDSKANVRSGLGGSLAPPGSRSNPPDSKANGAAPAPEPFGTDGVAGSETSRKVGSFLDRFARWRRLVRQASLSRCLETVLAETQYDSWLLTQPRGQERRLNVQRLLTLAQEFDRFQRQGLFRFLQFVEAQRASEIEPEVTASPAENAIRLMSIHQSKGLEFPVLVVADLGKAFNLADLRAEIILDEQYGLCPQIKPPHTGKRYPSLPCWLARRRQRQELLGEELRLLYVAMTRARDTLILSGAITPGSWARQWLKCSPATAPPPMQVRTYTDWLACWFSRNAGVVPEGTREGSCSLLRWFLHDDSSLVAPKRQTEDLANTPQIAFESDAWAQVEKRLAWQYLFSAATQQPAKTSVSVLRRQSSSDDREESAPIFAREHQGAPLKFPGPTLPASGLRPISERELTAADVGSAHHQFLQWVALDRTDNSAALRQEAHRLEKETRLTAQQVAALDFEALAGFWNSELGLQIRARSELVQRELAFTARFSPAELASMLGRTPDQSLEGEFILAQGVVDLAVVAPKEIWLVDFKTDQFDAHELPAKVKFYTPQLSLYAEALQRTYGRPVSQSWFYFLSLNTAASVRR
jgi:ATP-dependent helicase/nuclease subunit A